MSNDASNKTEKPTPRRIEQAREKGQVAKSQDLNSAIVLGAASLILVMMGPYTYRTLHAMISETFATLSTKPISVTGFSYIMSETIYALIWLLLPLLITVAVMGILVNLLQVKPMFSIKAIEPKLEKINPVQGFKRLFSMRSIVEVLKSLLKMAIIGGGGYWIIMSYLPELLATNLIEIPSGWMVVMKVIGLIALWSVVMFLGLGLADWRYQAYEMEKQLMMTRQEVKDERKNQEGDPMIKGRIRQMGIQMSKNRQVAQVPTADVVITNPTHFAIAIKYDPDIAPAPVVVAKGKDHFAQKIKEIAKENNVPMIENKPLARSLFKIAEIDSMIPPELSVAVAEVMAFIYAKSKGRKLPKRTLKEGPNA